jgi:hypothetical protein
MFRTARGVPIVGLAAVFLLLSSGAWADEPAKTESELKVEKVAQGKSYGKELSDSDVVPISKILAEPQAYVGKTVKVQGRILDVCKKRGCWMELASDEEFQSIRFKVEDGVIVFPLEAKGHEAIAEGVLERIELSMEQTMAMHEHVCKEEGIEFDPSKVEGPMVIYRIAGQGAVVF